MPSELKATGNCFENCGRYMLENPFTDMTLVHCVVTGTGSNVKGIRYSHAFLITEDGNFAIDMTDSADDPKTVPLVLYRAVGKIEMELHYSAGEARAEMLRTETFGAWDESLITEADRMAS